MLVEYFCIFFPDTWNLFWFALSAPWSLHRAKGMRTASKSVESCLKTGITFSVMYGGMLAHWLHPIEGKHTAHYTVPKSNLCVPRNETARPRFPIPTFMYICERFIYSIPKSVCLFGCSNIGRPILGIYCINCSQIRAHYNFVSFFGFMCFYYKFVKTVAG